MRNQFDTSDQKEHVASLKTSCISSGLISAGASNLQNASLKFIAAKVIVSSTVESRNDHRVTRTPEPSRRQLLACVASFYDIHGSLSCTNCTEVGDQGCGEGGLGLGVYSMGFDSGL